MMPCLACMCVEFSFTCTQCMPICFTAGKFYCCAGSCGFPECPPCSCEGDPCYTEERGCLEIQEKICCLYTESQCPPSMNIGIGCCGIRCCGGEKEEDEGEESDA